MSKKVVIGVVAIFAIIAAYVGSPYWTMHRMISAGAAGEGDRVATHVDFPAVRESMRTQMTAYMAKQMPRVGKDNPFAGLGQMLASSMINSMVDNLVTPEGLAGLLTRGKAERQKADSTATVATETPTTDKVPHMARGYEGLDVFKVAYSDPESNEPMVTFVLNRGGVFSWKLVAIRMHYLDRLK